MGYSAADIARAKLKAASSINQNEPWAGNRVPDYRQFLPPLPQPKPKPKPQPAPTPTRRASKPKPEPKPQPKVYSAPKPKAPKKPKPEPVKPDFELPMLQFTDEADPMDQFNRMRSLDSIEKQKAVIDAYERGVPSGRIHTAQQEGSAERAIEDRLLPFAQTKASHHKQQQLTNWQTEVNKRTLKYQNSFEDYLRDKGYNHEKAIEMSRQQAAIFQSAMTNVTSLLNNNDLVDLNQGVYDKIMDIANTSLKNTNLILDMGFTY